MLSAELGMAISSAVMYVMIVRRRMLFEMTPGTSAEGFACGIIWLKTARA